LSAARIEVLTARRRRKGFMIWGLQGFRLGDWGLAFFSAFQVPSFLFFFFGHFLWLLGWGIRLWLAMS
jgi:hypothetical protein